jgi:hypothetical protein
MAITSELHKRFLTNTDDTGRFVVYSTKTGIAYYVEPLEGGERRDWGDVDPATKATTGTYGEKYRGAVHKRDSLIDEKHGFQNVTTLPAGTSPNWHIDYIDDMRYAEGYRPRAV